MTKSELTADLAAANPHLTGRDVELIVATVFDEITAALARGERVELRGFGAFTVKHRSARTGRNPRTGEAVPVDEKAARWRRLARQGNGCRRRGSRPSRHAVADGRGKECIGADEMVRVIVALPFLALIALFALSNTQPVHVGIWPTDYAWDTPLSIVVLAGAAIAFLLGAVIVWIGELGQRRRARRAEQAVRVLEQRLNEMRAQLGQPVAPPS